MNKNQSGFSANILLLCVVVIGSIVAAGYYVHSRQNIKEAETSLAQLSDEQESSVSAPKLDVQAGKTQVGFAQYTDNDSKVAFVYPKIMQSEVCEPSNTISNQYGQKIPSSPAHYELGGFDTSTVPTAVFKTNNGYIVAPQYTYQLSGTQTDNNGRDIFTKCDKVITTAEIAASAGANQQSEQYPLFMITNLEILLSSVAKESDIEKLIQQTLNDSDVSASVQPKSEKMWQDIDVACMHEECSIAGGITRARYYPDSKKVAVVLVGQSCHLGFVAGGTECYDSAIIDSLTFF